MKKNSDAVIIFLVSFLLNFIWESIHAVPLYEGIANYSWTAFIRLILYASFIDALMISCIFLAGSLIFRRKWLSPYNKAQKAFTAIAGIIISIIIELRALSAHRWSYTTLMPTIAGIGLSPMLQLAATGIMTMILLKEKKKK